MAYKLSLEINTKITPKTFIASLKVLYNISQIKKKKITFEQYFRIHVAGPKVAICETTSKVVLVYTRLSLQETNTFEPQFKKL